MCARKKSGPTLESVALSAALLLCASAVSGQVSPPPSPGVGTVTVVPGEAYDASGLYAAVLGRGYRSLWTTPIEVPVADLDVIGGGLTPVREGGGTTTRTLHLDGADGRRYVFRSVNKTPRELLEDFEGSALESIIQDQISSFHPSGAPVVAALLDAVDVLHPDPSFMVVPDDPRLGEFREAFAGLLVLVEERPDDGEDGAPGFAGSREIVQTDDLFDALEDDPSHHVDAGELLRARLVDLLVGDRDRSHNNHLWARFPDGEGGRVWKVIPRDRDQAFVRFDGAAKALARTHERRLVSFGASYPNLFGLTRNAWDIDRNLLVGLDRATWDDVVAEVTAALTDELIADAVRRMPPEHVAVLGDELTEMLRARRDRLPEAAETLYRIVFQHADVHGTDVDEELRVVRGMDGLVTVTITPAGWDRPSFHRAFTEAETEEIRIYMHGGEDRVLLEGVGAEGVVVRVIGGNDADTYLDRTREGGSQTIVYDAGEDTEMSGPGAARLERREAPRPFSWFEGVRELDWGTRTIPVGVLSYDPDRGLLIVPGLRHHRYGFLKDPFSMRMQVRAGWAFGLHEPYFDFRHLARRVLGSADFRLRFSWSGIEIINFYGFGNETEAEGPRSRFRVAHKQVTATAALSFGDGQRRYLDLGPTFTYTSTDTAEAATLIAEQDPYGSGKFTHAGARLSFGLDSRDHQGTPTSGLHVTGGASAYPAWFDVQKGAFGEVHGSASAYLSPAAGNPVLALRAAGKKAWGPYPLTEAAWLGGPETLRGLREQRYAGDAFVLGSAELRVEVGRVKFPIPADVGLFAFGDVGRVHWSEERSTRWHASAGGGVWVALVNRSNVFRVGLARSERRTALEAGVGFAY